MGMEYWKEEIQELVEDLKTPIGIARAVIVVFLLGCIVKIGLDGYQTATIRKTYLFQVLFALALTMILTLDYKDQLETANLAPPPAGKKLKSRMKFSAEICAAVGILSFFLSFYRLGIDIDRANADGRIVHLTNVARHIDSTICRSSPVSAVQCAAWSAQFKEVSAAIRAGDEKAVGKGIKRLKGEIALALATLPDDLPYWLNADLNAALIEEDTRVFTLVVLSLTLIFSSFAVSRKVALAWVD